MLPILRNNSTLASVATGPVNRLDWLFDHVFGGRPTPSFERKFSS